MAVLNAQYRHPPTSAYSQGLRDLIDSMLKVDPNERPDIHEVRDHSCADGFVSCVDTR
jgi:serine/threonine kinase 16